MKRKFQRLLSAVVLWATVLLAGHADASGADPLQEQEAWLVRTARMEGAAGNIEEWAQSLQETTGDILEERRLTALSELISRAEELNARVVGATLAAEVLDQPL